MTENPTSRATAFTVEREGDLAIIWFDLAGEKVNKFSSSVIREFAAVVDALETSDAKRIVLASRKPGIFIAGADVSEFTLATTVEQAKEYTRFGNQLFHRFSKRVYSFACSTVVARVNSETS